MTGGKRFLIGQYKPGSGYFYRLDPRTKIILVISIMIAAIINTAFIFYGALIVALILLLLSCQIGLGAIYKNLKPIFWFVVFTALFHLIFSGHNDPEKILRLGSVSVSRKAIEMAIIFSGRIVVFVLATFLISLTTSPISISEAVVSLVKPLRYIGVPVYDLGMIMFIALRFIPVLADEVETVRKAQVIRGVEFSGNLWQRIKRSSALILPVFYSALRRADDLSTAIETRGYRAGRPRTSLYPLKFSLIDTAVITAGMLVLVGAGWGRWC